MMLFPSRRQSRANSDKGTRLEQDYNLRLIRSELVDPGQTADSTPCSEAFRTQI
jgi:hypothetical protein